jgi:hypothetical protein
MHRAWLGGLSHRTAANRHGLAETKLRVMQAHPDGHAPRGRGIVVRISGRDADLRQKGACFAR